MYGSFSYMGTNIHKDQQNQWKLRLIGIPTTRGRIKESVEGIMERLQEISLNCQGASWFIYWWWWLILWVTILKILPPPYLERRCVNHKYNNKVKHQEKRIIWTSYNTWIVEVVPTSRGSMKWVRPLFYPTNLPQCGFGVNIIMVIGVKCLVFGNVNGRWI